MSTDPLSSDFSYRKYSLQQLDNWVNDALNCEDLTPKDIYDTIVKCVEESVDHHRKYLDKSTSVLSLLRGHREFEIDTTLDDVVGEREYYDGWDSNHDPMKKQVDLHKDQYEEILKFYRPKTHQEMLNDGWEMTADGFWYKD
jgi:hypothetical protein